MLNMNLHLGRVNTQTEEQFKLGFRRVLEFDCDVSGENGTEYIWKEAELTGFDSTASYLIEQYTVKYGSTLQAIVEAITEVFQRDRDHYRRYQIQTDVTTPNVIIVALAFSTDN